MGTAMDDGRQIFVDESRELLAKMEEVLLSLEGQPPGGLADAESINALFRAAHTIKGSAGLFAFNRIVAFTHVLENVIERVRAGRLPLDAALIELALRCADHVGTLLQTVATTNADSDVAPSVASTGEMLVSRLNDFLTPTAPPAAVAAVSPPAPPVADDEIADDRVASECWHLSLRFGPDVLRNGMDPLSFVRYLGTLGTVEQIVTVPDRLPRLPDFDAESCYLGFEIRLRSTADRKTIADVFEFVRDDCRVEIFAPRSQVTAYAALIKSLPEPHERLGEILVACGALTAAELEAALTAQRESPTPPRPLGAMLVETGAVDPDVVDAALTRQQRSHVAGALEQGRFLRVPADKLDRLITLVGELVIAGSAAGTLARDRGDAAMREAATTVDSLVEEIRESAMRLRMVPVGETFNRFQRVVRDVSRDLGKEIALQISGGDTELDKSMVEKLNDPLMHIVRNAIDHGIEDRDTRLRAGKPAGAEVRLHAYHDSGSVIIEVSDDGRGLDRDRILEKGRERGLVAPNDDLTDDEIFGLIFEPGFSTAEKVTNLSGRGVGMDVVRRNIGELRGTVALASRVGAGTTVTIRLPLTLAIIDGFLVKVGASSYVVPLDAVFECIELPPGHHDGLGGTDYLNLRGQVLPLLRLRDVFGIAGPPSRRQSIVVLHDGAQRAGLVVDQLLGEHQTVIKPLGKLFAAVPGIGGSTVLGNGEVALIIDVSGLIQRALVKQGGGRRLGRAAGAPAAEQTTKGSKSHARIQ